MNRVLGPPLFSALKCTEALSRAFVRPDIVIVARDRCPPSFCMGLYNESEPTGYGVRTNCASVCLHWVYRVPIDLDFYYVDTI